MSEALISCSLGIPERDRQEAARILYAAFQRKLQPLPGAPERVQRILAAGLNLDVALGAYDGERLVGLAGLHLGSRHLFGMTLRHCVACTRVWRSRYSAPGAARLTRCGSRRWRSTLPARALP
jgi:hypothetical protein